MRTITAVEAQQRDPERVNIYLDGEFAFGATLMAVYAEGLTVGRTLSPEEVESLKRDDEVDRAFAATLNFLSFRPRSQREVAQYLRKRKTDPAATDAVLDRLARAGLLNDAEFARFWVENRQTFRPRGTRALKAELRLKGVEGDVIESALETVGDEEEIAFRAARRKAVSLRDAEEREFFTKILGYLQRRGFPYAASSGAARRLYREMHQGESDNFTAEDF